MPYVKAKLDNIYSRLQEVDDATPLQWWSGCGLRHAAAVLFFRIYPYACSLWEVVQSDSGLPLTWATHPLTSGVDKINRRNYEVITRQGPV